MKATLDRGLRVYAIGDVHGCWARLDKLLARIAIDLSSWAGRTRLVFLGDYVDRGRDSAGVVERLTEGPGALGLPDEIELICLKGNHEDLLLRALASEDGLPVWLANGGDATCESYGLDVRSFLAAVQPLPALRQALCQAVPAHHRAFLEALPLSHTAGGYFFCHAGARPGLPLDRQEEDDLIWIREPFLTSDRDFGRLVVHGHTPRAEPEVLDNRIGIDTGAVFGGRLTALRLEEDRRHFLQV